MAGWTYTIISTASILSTSDSTVAIIAKPLSTMDAVTSSEMVIGMECALKMLKMTGVVKNNCIFWQKEAEK